MTGQFLFFPFTHITRNQLDTILTFFPSFQYFPARMDFNHHQKLQELFEQGKINPLFSSPEELVAVEQKVRQYLEWGRIHKGNEVNLKSLLKDNPYFTSDSDMTVIKSQIKGIKEDKGNDIASLPGDPVLEHNLLFLKMAQLCDEQNERIDLQLKELDKSRDNLISALRGLDSPLSDDKNSKTQDYKDSGLMMIRERIYAWSGCMAQKDGLKHKEGLRPLFVTTSKAVFDCIESHCQKVVNALDIDKIKVHENECENKNEWQHHFCDYLMRVIQGTGIRGNEMPKVNDGCSLSGQIKLSLFSGNDINKLFNYSEKQIPVCLIKLK
ncbi:MAG: hypothetical protein KOO65_13635 [Desulfobacterales bacterium]|nr:hypothetical protein [Desulfobacterales bacterium]